MKYFITWVPGTWKSTIWKLLESKGFTYIDVDDEKDLASWYNQNNDKVPPIEHADDSWYGLHDWYWDAKVLEEYLVITQKNMFLYVVWLQIKQKI